MSRGKGIEASEEEEETSILTTFNDFFLMLPSHLLSLPPDKEERRNEIYHWPPQANGRERKKGWKIVLELEAVHPQEVSSLSTCFPRPFLKGRWDKRKARFPPCPSSKIMFYTHRAMVGKTDLLGRLPRGSFVSDSGSFSCFKSSTRWEQHVHNQKNQTRLLRSGTTWCSSDSGPLEA